MRRRTAAIPAFADLAVFVLRFFTATDFFAVFADFDAFFIALAMCPPDADASAILAQRIGPECRSVSHPRDERVV